MIVGECMVMLPDKVSTVLDGAGQPIVTEERHRCGKATLRGFCVRCEVNAGILPWRGLAHEERERRVAAIGSRRFDRDRWETAAGELVEVTAL